MAFDKSIFEDVRSLTRFIPVRVMSQTGTVYDVICAVLCVYHVILQVVTIYDLMVYCVPCTVDDTAGV
jgi:hypothetical protein